MTSHEPPVFMEEDDDHSSYHSQDLDAAADEDDEVSVIVVNLCVFKSLVYSIFSFALYHHIFLLQINFIYNQNFLFRLFRIYTLLLCAVSLMLMVICVAGNFNFSVSAGLNGLGWTNAQRL